MNDFNFGSLIAFALLCLVCFIGYRIYKQFKFPKINALTLVSGGVKTGKTTFAVALAMQNYNRLHRRWKIKKFLATLLHRDFDTEEPLLYSNIPLAVPYVPLTEDLLLRKSRFRFGSVILCSEASLVADSQMIKTDSVNNRLLLFNKLIGHELHGSYLIYDTQSVSDTHYSIKRSLSEYFYIHHLTKWIPFFMVAYVREERYCADNTSINTYDKDVEETLTRVIIPKSVWKKFDSYCYSCITDDLPCEDNVVVADNLKANRIVSFRKWDKYFAKTDEIKEEKEELKNEKENN